MKAVSYKFIFLFILLAFQTACGQTQTKPDKLTVKVVTKEEATGMIKTAYPNLKPQAEILRKAFLAEDFDTYTDFMHPTPVEVVGGREKFISNLRSSI